MPEICFNMFDAEGVAVSGRARGVGYLSMAFGKKSKTIGKVIFFTSQAPDVTFDIPKKVAFCDIPAMTAAINDFHRQIAEIDSARK